ncbi:DUF368 domain-containing protein [Chengkuizengella axinellae]|uniref:DUF368 domain-containing protein n=1 Tax=Chengkuizengella axinellae TaxID=3064388 RepID=A0ABT9J175_9BACL|nr:DUF368 domain-containing protein [Chengkuizengella sp. 2205SS18-9]MDP5275365.1 DUF368 domain-containing protein [Chengkuizengella sp. 2205SS18-9]
MDWKNLYKGFLMGTSDIIPGVSAGTIAVVVGVYDKVLESINGIFSREWKRHLLFLLPIAIGMLAAIGFLSNIMELLLEQFPQPTFFFFLGLIIGILPFLFIEAGAKTNFTARHYILLIIFGIAIASMRFFQEESNAAIWDTIGPTELVLLFLSGWMASSAMILPGVSGSFLLLLFGVYPTIIRAVSDFDLVILAVVGLGVILGLAIMSRLLHYLISNFSTMMYAIIIGMVSGSTIVIFPGLDGEILLSLITLCLGLAAAYALGKIEHSSKSKKL